MVLFTLDQAYLSFKASCDINHARYRMELFSRPFLPPGEGGFGHFYSPTPTLSRVVFRLSSSCRSGTASRKEVADGDEGRVIFFRYSQAKSGLVAWMHLVFFGGEKSQLTAQK